RWMVWRFCVVVAAAVCSVKAGADTPSSPPEATDGALAPAVGAPPEIFTRARAIGWALQNNPELAAFRQQHGIAAAMVVIAKTYPFNPVWTSKLFAVSAPPEEVRNRLAMEQRVSIPVEIRGQGAYRRQAACAALSRTDWEIANQETVVAIRVVRAFDAALY